jgi:hypothetical protein
LIRAHFFVFVFYFSLGFVVFAGCLMKDKGADTVKQLDDAGNDTGRLITVQMNVTSDAEVATAVETVRANLPPSIKVGRFFFQRVTFH